MKPGRRGAIKSRDCRSRELQKILFVHSPVARSSTMRLCSRAQRSFQGKEGVAPTPMHRGARSAGAWTQPQVPLVPRIHASGYWVPARLWLLAECWGCRWPFGPRLAGGRDGWWGGRWNMRSLGWLQCCCASWKVQFPQSTTLTGDASKCTQIALVTRNAGGQ